MPPVIIGAAASATITTGFAAAGIGGIVIGTAVSLTATFMAAFTTSNVLGSASLPLSETKHDDLERVV